MNRWPLAIAVGSVLALTGLAAGKEDISIQWDPQAGGGKVSAVWLGYLMARAAYRPEHHVPLPASGEIVPTFEEEVYARDTAATIYSELRQKDGRVSDKYWDDLLKVQAKKFMPQYVWTFLRKASWTNEKEPPNLDVFHKWSSQNLQNHKPETHGGLTVSGG